MDDQVFRVPGGMPYSLDRIPDSCPLCHYAVHMEKSGWSFIPRQGSTPGLEIVFRCPRQSCGRFFIARYEPSTITDADIRLRGVFVLDEVVPEEPLEPEFTDEVRNISPSFVEIYTEASAAESWGLAQIAGVGYRKALEFLIKDYCISLGPADEEDIKKIHLGPCITKFVKDPNVQECAKRAVWLGNDETHYSRRWAEKDVSHMKQFIALTVHWISSSVLTEQLIADMPQGGGS